MKQKLTLPAVLPVDHIRATLVRLAWVDGCGPIQVRITADGVHDLLGSRANLQPTARTARRCAGHSGPCQPRIAGTPAALVNSAFRGAECSTLSSPSPFLRRQARWLKESGFKVSGFYPRDFVGDVCRHGSPNQKECQDRNLHARSIHSSNGWIDRQPIRQARARPATWRLPRQAPPCRGHLPRRPCHTVARSPLAASGAARGR